MLRDLKYKDNPITDSESSQTSRQIVIASIATLKVNTMIIQIMISGVVKLKRGVPRGPVPPTFFGN